ncbi:hypothetical protein Plec18170_002046 [Paecilomyces lecythidis]
MSTNLPDDFTVDTCDLNDGFTAASRVPGRRGREVGKGSTATVKIMLRKDCHRGILYAVKEFRKCGSQEDSAEYEKKVKSEFSIANSLHHPNIVETDTSRLQISEFQKFSAASILVYALLVASVEGTWVKYEDASQGYVEACRTLRLKFWQRNMNMILAHLMFGHAQLSASPSVSVVLHGKLLSPKIPTLLGF